MPPRRLPEVKTLWDLLPKGAEGGKEFARIIDLLRFHEARRSGRNIQLLSDIAGDFKALDGFETDHNARTGFQYKFFPTPFSSDHRAQIKDSLIAAKEAQAERRLIRLEKWILVTPTDLTESATRKDGGDVTWFDGLEAKLELPFKIEHWGHRAIQGLFLEDPSLCLFYYPELTPDGSSAQRTIQDLRKRYDIALAELYQEIQFVGVAVREQKTTQGIPMKDIYIPLDLFPEGIKEDTARRKPLVLLGHGAQSVVLGDPGSGKSTLLRFLALSGQLKELQQRYDAASDDRLPVLVILRRYAHELATRHNLSLRDYVLDAVKGDVGVPADERFLDYYLESGNVMLLFDGLDELPDSGLRATVRDRIRTLLKVYPRNTAIISSRFVGYEGQYRFKAEEFAHYQVAPLQVKDMQRFVSDWYAARISNAAERKRNTEDLHTILTNPQHTAIRELAENPLLLTIIALVHRIEADLPDERVLLYRKCTETLLSTWQNYKAADLEGKKPGRAERRNLYRIEAIAHWMQRRGSKKRERAVVTHHELHAFLTEFIQKEEPTDPDHEPDQLATSFVDFVRERAGLLIEAGDGLYSFVHLTFQEYLAAEYMCRKSRDGGVEQVWELIREVQAEPRWHEVLRLLIAGYDNPTAEATLVTRILGHQKDLPPPCLELLEGLLLDGVSAAEQYQDRIVENSVRACVTAASQPELVAHIEMLRAWVPRDARNSAAFNGALKSVKPETGELLAALVLPGAPPRRAIQRFFQGATPTAKELDTYDELLQRLQQADYGAFDSPGGNFLAASLYALTGIPVARAYREMFRLLVALTGMGTRGPQQYFYWHTSLISGATELDLDLDLDRALARDRALDRDLDRARVRDRARDRARVRDRALDRDLDLDLSEPTRNWFHQFLVSSKSLLLAEMWVEVFSLRPAPLWLEYLRTTVFPSLFQRPNFMDRSLWQQTTERFATGVAKEIDCWLAAQHLLVDADLYVLEVYNQSPIRKLAGLTKDIDFPALRIAHCIRDISYDPDGPRGNDLRAMVESADPSYQSIFREAYWID